MMPTKNCALLLVLAAMCLGFYDPDPASCITKVVKTVNGEGAISWKVECAGSCDSMNSTDCKKKGAGTLEWCECQDGGDLGTPPCMAVLFDGPTSTGVRCIKNDCESACEPDDTVNSNGISTTTTWTCACVGS